MSPVILIIDPDPATANLAREVLGSEYDLLTAVDVPTGEELLRNRPVEVLICEDSLPGETGLMFMARTRNEFPATRRIMLTAEIESDILLFAINEVGLFRCLTKPLEPDLLRKLVAEGVSQYQLETGQHRVSRENLRLKAELQDRPPPVPRRSSRVMAGLTWLRVFVFGLVVLGALFVVGVILLLLLYALKTYIGIDFFEDMHLYNLLK